VLIAVIVTVLSAPAGAHARADASPQVRSGNALLAGTSWHGRAIREPHARRAPATDVSSSRRTARPIERGDGYATPGGSRRVREVQRRLLRLGYRPGPKDGLYGPRTEGAVRWFQFKHGFAPTGSVGPAVLRVLRSRTNGRAGDVADRPPARTDRQTDRASTPASQAARAPRPQPSAAQAPPPLGAALNVFLIVMGAVGVAVIVGSYLRARSRFARARRSAGPPAVGDGAVARPPTQQDGDLVVHGVRDSDKEDGR